MENVKAKPIRLQQFGELMQRGLPPEPSEDEADESLVAKVMDERDRHNSLTDVNRTTSTMDEDGDLDASPIISKLSMITNYPRGMHQEMTTVEALIHVPAGFAAKRTCVPGNVSAKKLGDLLLGIDKW